MKRRRSTSRKNRIQSSLAAAQDIDWLDVEAPPTSSRPAAAGKRAKTASSKANKILYIRETMRPIVCLAFVLPMLLLYEFGSVFSDQLSGKSGIDLWLHWLMNLLGAGQLVILPVLTAGALLYWHHHIGDQWQFKPSVLIGMLAESCCLGLTLYFAGNAVYQIISTGTPPHTIASGELSGAACWNSTIAFIGCGVYEELIFRLLLLNGLIHLARKYLGEMEAKSVAMIVTSLVFAALHFDILNPAGAAFDANGFLFRFFASLIFCILFLFRGFGIAVGTHAIYDVMTQL